MKFRLWLEWLTSRRRHTFERANGKPRALWVLSLVGASCEVNVGQAPCDVFVVKLSAADARARTHPHTPQLEISRDAVMLDQWACLHLV